MPGFARCTSRRSSRLRLLRRHCKKSSEAISSARDGKAGCATAPRVDSCGVRGVRHQRVVLPVRGEVEHAERRDCRLAAAHHGLTITSARIWHWAVLPRSSGWPWPLSFYFGLPWKTGAFHCRSFSLSLRVSCISNVCFVLNGEPIRPTWVVGVQATNCHPPPATAYNVERLIFVEK